MKKFLVVLFVLVAGLSCPSCSASPKSPNRLKDEPTTVRIINNGGGKCSATAVGPHTLLTASHCFRTATNNLLMVDDTVVQIDRVLQDGNDHALVTLKDVQFLNVAVLGEPAKTGDNIHYWGNPSIFSYMFRKGYVSGVFPDRTMYDINGFHGDSGAGIFNDKKEIVGVISYIFEAQAFTMMGSFPLNFTKEQVQAADLLPNTKLMSGIKAKVDIK
jgi:hypothetical protein